MTACNLQGNSLTQFELLYDNNKWQINNKLNHAICKVIQKAELKCQYMKYLRNVHTEIPHMLINNMLLQKILP